MLKLPRKVRDILLYLIYFEHFENLLYFLKYSKLAELNNRLHFKSNSEKCIFFND